MKRFGDASGDPMPMKRRRLEGEDEKRGRLQGGGSLPSSTAPNLTSSQQRQKALRKLECVVKGIVRNENVDRFLQRLGAVCDRTTRKTAWYNVIEKVYENRLRKEELRVRLVDQAFAYEGKTPRSLELWEESKHDAITQELVWYGDYEVPEKSVLTSVRSIIQAPVEGSLEDLILALGLETKFEHGRIGQHIITKHGVEIELFRLVTTKSIQDIRKLKRRSVSKWDIAGRVENGTSEPMFGNAEDVELDYIVPKGASDTKMLLVKVSKQADGESENKTRVSREVRNFVEKLRPHFVEVEP